jgi:hypothetical protein
MAFPPHPLLGHPVIDESLLCFSLVGWFVIARSDTDQRAIQTRQPRDTYLLASYMLVHGQDDNTPGLKD